MLQALRRLLPQKSFAPVPMLQPEPPASITAPGAEPFHFAAALKMHHGLPIPDWAAVTEWIDRIVPADERAQAWASCELAWLLHLARALGPSYRMDTSPHAGMVSSLEPNVARATLDYIERSQKRITAVLDGIAETPEWGRELLVVFDDQDRYYQYASFYYAEDGEFAFSGGMYINSGCGHFVTVKADLRSVEPVIVHEMTHAALSHLSIPAWLNEGLAVNTEQRLAGRHSLYSPAEMHQKHLAFWGTEEIQEFWSGKSFLRTDDGNLLSYDLARILVEQFAKDWDRFRKFVLAANGTDGGGAAAREHLEMPLGACVTALLEGDDDTGWDPEPAAWRDEPEKGRFRQQTALSGSIRMASRLV